MARDPAAFEDPAAFARARGRPLRVLHVGNIANNAYNNAKIQRARGIEADVLSFEYYHVMACPEWEDGDFEGDVGDANMPDWWGVRFRRPFQRARWFAQGTLDLCIRMLLARHRGSAWSRAWTWGALEFERWVISRRSFPARVVRHLIKRFGGRIAGVESPPLMILARRAAAVLRRLGLGRTALARRLDLFARRSDPKGSAPEHHARSWRRREAAVEAANLTLRETGRALAPSELDRVYAWWWHPYLKTLFDTYDVVQCYATYTALPFAARYPAYAAYEHGTIRSIPFEDDTQGKLCMASYRAADLVLVTNTDCLVAADRMGLDPARIVALPHAFDSDKFEAFARQAGPRARPDGPPRFLAPARHDWVDADPSFAKGNERLIDALRLLKDRGETCQVTLVEWGRDVEASRARIAALDVADMVVWTPVMGKRELWEQYLSVDGVLDQFVTPAFGGVTFEAMMLGALVISAFDLPVLERFFGEAPPVDDVRDAARIADALSAVIRDPAGARRRGEEALDWMRRRHSADRIVALQMAAYGRSVATS